MTPLTVLRNDALVNLVRMATYFLVNLQGIKVQEVNDPIRITHDEMVAISTEGVNSLSSERLFTAADKLSLRTRRGTPPARWRASCKPVESASKDSE